MILAGPILLEPRPGPLRCAVCHDAVANLWRCHRCSAITHSDCWPGRCPSLGCGPRARFEHELPWFERIRRGPWRLVLVLVPVLWVCLLLTVSAEMLGWTAPPERSEVGREIAPDGALEPPGSKVCPACQDPYWNCSKTFISVPPAHYGIRRDPRTPTSRPNRRAARLYSSSTRPMRAR